MKKHFLLGLAGALILLAAGAAILIWWTRGPQPQAAAAVVNGEAITWAMVDAEVNVSRLNVMTPLPPLAGPDLRRAQQEALNQLVTRRLILQAAARQNFALTEADVAKKIDLLFGSAGRPALENALAQTGVSRADVAWWVREIFTVEGFTTQVIMAGVRPEDRQQVYNDWLNTQRAAARIETFLNGAAQAPGGLVGQPAPSFSLSALDGAPVSLADYRGRVVLVNFWATWCPSCLSEMPDYEQVYQELGGPAGDFAVLAVNFQEGPDSVARYAAGLGLTFPVLLDRQGDVTTRLYQATGMPASILVARDGVIHYRHLGPMSADTLRGKLRELGL
jgi:thiol-disulfide isomerase/thioredoxin